jgi:hypothetical protein
VALLAPLTAGALVMVTAALRGLALPWAAAGTAVVLVLMAPSLAPQVARWVRTFPAPGADGPSSDPVWWTVLAVCAVAIAISVGGRRLPRWTSRVP